MADKLTLELSANVASFEAGLNSALALLDKLAAKAEEIAGSVSAAFSKLDKVDFGRAIAAGKRATDTLVDVSLAAEAAVVAAAQKAAEQMARGEEKASDARAKAAERLADRKAQLELDAAKAAQKAADAAVRDVQRAADEQVRAEEKAVQQRLAALRKLESENERIASQLQTGFINAFQRGFSLIERGAVRLFDVLSGGGFEGLIKSSVDFERAVADVGSILDKTAAPIGVYRDAILQIARGTSKDVVDLTKGLYDAISSGVSPALKAGGALDLLNQAQRAAVAGLANTKDSVKAGTIILNTFGGSAGNLKTVFDKLFESVNIGVFTFPELSSVIGKVTSVATSAGVSFDEMLGALATLSKQGLSAGQSVTGLRQLIIGILAPTEKAKQVAHDYGFELGQAAIKHQTFEGVIKNIVEKLGDNAEAYRKLIPRQEGYNALLKLAKDNGQAFSDDIERIAHGVGALDRALASQTNTVDFQLGVVRNRFQIMAAEIFTKVSPTIIEALRQIASSLDGVNVNGIVDRLKGIIKVAGDIIEYLKGFGESAKAIFETVSTIIETRLVAGGLLVLRQTISDLETPLKLLRTQFGGVGKEAENVAPKVSSLGGVLGKLSIVGLLSGFVSLIESIRLAISLGTTLGEVLGKARVDADKKAEGPGNREDQDKRNAQAQENALKLRKEEDDREEVFIRDLIKRGRDLTAAERSKLESQKAIHAEEVADLEETLKKKQNLTDDERQDAEQRLASEKLSLAQVKGQLKLGKVIRDEDFGDYLANIERKRTALSIDENTTRKQIENLEKLRYEQAVAIHNNSGQAQLDPFGNIIEDSKDVGELGKSLTKTDAALKELYSHQAEVTAFNSQLAKMAQQLGLESSPGQAAGNRGALIAQRFFTELGTDVEKPKTKTPKGPGDLIPQEKPHRTAGDLREANKELEKENERAAENEISLLSKRLDEEQLLREQYAKNEVKIDKDALLDLSQNREINIARIRQLRDDETESEKKAAKAQLDIKLAKLDKDAKADIVDVQNSLDSEAEKNARIEQIIDDYNRADLADREKYRQDLAKIDDKHDKQVLADKLKFAAQDKKVKDESKAYTLKILKETAEGAEDARKKQESEDEKAHKAFVEKIKQYAKSFVEEGFVGVVRTYLRRTIDQLVDDGSEDLASGIELVKKQFAGFGQGFAEVFFSASAGFKKFGDDLRNLDFGKVWGDLKAGATAVFSVQFWKDLWSGAKSGLTNIDWKALAGGVAKAFWGAFEIGLSAFVNLALQGFNFLVSKFQGFVELAGKFGQTGEEKKELGRAARDSKNAVDDAQDRIDQAKSDEQLARDKLRLATTEKERLQSQHDIEKAERRTQAAIDDLDRQKVKADEDAQRAQDPFKFELNKQLNEGKAFIDNLVDNLPTLFDALQDYLPQFFDKITAQLPKILQLFAHQIPLLIAVIARHLPDITKAFANQLGPIVDGIIAVLPDVMDAIAASLPAVIENLTKVIIGKLPVLATTLVASSIQYFVAHADEIVVAIVNGLAEGITDLFNKLIDAIDPTNWSLFAEGGVVGDNKSGAKAGAVQSSKFGAGARVIVAHDGEFVVRNAVAKQPAVRAFLQAINDGTADIASVFQSSVGAVQSSVRTAFAPAQSGPITVRVEAPPAQAHPPTQVHISFNERTDAGRAVASFVEQSFVAQARRQGANVRNARQVVSKSFVNLPRVRPVTTE